MENTLTGKYQYAAENGTVFGKDKPVVAAVNPDGSQIGGGGGTVTINNFVTNEDIGDVADTFKDVGTELDCIDYKSIGIYIKFVANDSTGCQLKVLAKHTVDDADEYKHKNAADYIIDLDVTDEYFLLFNATGINYIQIQTKALVLGATEGTVSIDIVKEY